MGVNRLGWDKQSLAGRVFGSKETSFIVFFPEAVTFDRVVTQLVATSPQNPINVICHGLGLCVSECKSFV